jgi:hypothetical protein
VLFWCCSGDLLVLFWCCSGAVLVLFWFWLKRNFWKKTEPPNA